MHRSDLLHSRKRQSTVRPALISYAVFLIGILALLSRVSAASALSPVAPAGKSAQAKAAAQTLLKLPLRFESTADGQAMAAHFGSQQLRLGKAGTVELRTATGNLFSIALEGANQQSVPAGQGELPGKSNYFLGRDSAKWRKGVEQFSQAALGVKFQ